MTLHISVLLTLSVKFAYFLVVVILSIAVFINCICIVFIVCIVSFIASGVLCVVYCLSVVCCCV
jgi:hypothetical protein